MFQHIGGLHLPLLPVTSPIQVCANLFSKKHIGDNKSHFVMTIDIPTK